MGYNLNCSGVLTGNIHSFCLACDVFLKTEPEAEEHIKAQSHFDNLNAYAYLENYKDDYIRKFKRGYYCKFCNILLSIAAKVTIHITEDEHKYRKGSFLLQPDGNSILAFNDAMIEETAWHGLVEDICSICNSECDEDSHKNDLSHLLNLVLKPVRFGHNNAVYRHVDDSTIQCMTCNKLVASNAMDKHFNDDEHLQLYNSRNLKTITLEDFKPNKKSEVSLTKDEAVAKNGTTDEKIIELNNNNNKQNNKQMGGNKKAKILESISKYQNNGMNINLETETAFCKKCAEVIHFDDKEIENHIENHSSAKNESKLQYPSNFDKDLNKLDINDKTSEKNSDDENCELFDTASACTSNESENNAKFDDEVREYAKENNITYNPENNNAYCRTCEVKLPSSFKSLKEHVAGANHKSRNAKKVVEEPKPKLNTPPLSKMETRHFAKSSFGISGLLCQDNVINEEYCMSQMSSWLVTEINSRYRCHVCDVYLPPNMDLEMHAKTIVHSSKSGLVPIITSEVSEFIREVRRDLFHCGFCNLLVSGWDEMKQHLECTEHKTKKAFWKRRLNSHLPGIQEYKAERAMRAMQLMWVLNRFG